MKATLSRVSRLVLIGFMGTGKSTAGALCSARLGLAFYDTDQLIEARAGMSIGEIFDNLGEHAFRSMEQLVIQELCASPGAVIATGGGAVLDAGNANALQAGGYLVLLEANPAEILSRVGDASTRPLLRGAQRPLRRIETILSARREAYLNASNAVVDTSGRSPEEVASEIAHLFRAAQELGQ